MARPKKDPDDERFHRLAEVDWPICVACHLPACLVVPLAISANETVDAGVCADCWLQTKEDQKADWDMNDHWLDWKREGGDA